MCWLSWNLGASMSWNPQGPVQASSGIALFIFKVRIGVGSSQHIHLKSLIYLHACLHVSVNSKLLQVIYLRLLWLGYITFPLFSLWRITESHNVITCLFQINTTIVLFLQPTLMHNSIWTCMSHYYPRHVSGLDMPILRRNNCTNTASGILAFLSGCTLHRLRAV